MKTNHSAIVLVAALAVGLLFPAAAAASPPAGPDRFGVDFGLGSRLIYTGSYEFYSENAGLFGGQTGFSWTPAAAGGRLGLDLRLSHSTSSATNFGVIDTRLRTTTSTVGAAVFQPIFRDLHVVGRFALGADLVHSRIDDSLGSSFTAGGLCPVIEGSLALELWVPTYRSGAVHRDLVFRLESGYGWRPLGVELKRHERKIKEDDPAPIERIRIDAGKLDLSGIEIRGSLGFRF